MIARGTGWDFVRTYQIPRRIEDAVDVALNGATREIDLGRVLYRSWAGADEVRWFANVASVGMSGAIAQRANETTKALGGRMSYLLATLSVFARWKVGDVRVSVDENVRGGRMHDVIVANGRYLGGGMMICPEARARRRPVRRAPDRRPDEARLMLTLPKTYRGKHLPHPKAEVLRGATVTVDAPSPLPVELDGEQPGTTPVRFELVPRALRIRVPRRFAEPSRSWTRSAAASIAACCSGSAARCDRPLDLRPALRRAETWEAASAGASSSSGERSAVESIYGAAVGGALRAGVRCSSRTPSTASATCFSSFAIRASSALIPCTRFVSSSSCFARRPRERQRAVHSRRFAEPAERVLAGVGEPARRSFSGSSCLLPSRATLTGHPAET